MGADALPHESTAFERLAVSVVGDVGVVELDRPPVNALDLTAYREIETVFSDPQQLAAKVRVIVLGARGKHFCAGNDLHDFLDLDYSTTPPITKLVRQAFFAISDCDVPVIAMVAGAALGSGLAIAASCDLVVASTDASFGLPEVSVGVMGGARHLARLVPQPMVRWMFLSGERASANDLHRLGGVHEVVAPDELRERALTIARTIARHSPVALRTGRRTLNVIESMGLKEGYEYEQSMTREMTRSADSKEAVRAVIERRPPQYSGT